MTRDQLLHLLRTSAQVLRDRGADQLQGELVVIGSQSILGQYPEAPATLTRSMEADIYPLRDPAMAEYIDGALGRDRPFTEPTGTTRKAWPRRPPRFRPVGMKG